MAKALNALGLMSGTSMDGIDVAHIQTDGKQIFEIGKTLFYPYSDEQRSLIRKAIESVQNHKGADVRTHDIQIAEQLIDDMHIQACEVFFKTNTGLSDSIDVIGYHGQTVLHAPERQMTLQLGRGEYLAEALGIDVVYDFRTQDVLAGGQGAPLVPIYHKALSERLGVQLPAVFINIGGVSNLTYMDKDILCAFDCGAGNALMDDYMLKHLNLPYDEGGQLAASGTSDAQRVARALSLDFFKMPYPKSLDRNAFAHFDVDGLSAADAMATLLDFTVSALQEAIKILPKSPSTVMVFGGGSKNQTMLGLLEKRLGSKIVLSDQFGLDALFVEAQAFAYLAVRYIYDLPISFPLTTGAKAPLSGGRLCPSMT